MTEVQKRTIAITLVLAFLSYTVYMYCDLPVRHAPASAMADRGKMLWQKHNCTACHQLYGLGGFLGPDLTNEYSKRGPDQIRAFLQVGNNTMPAYQMADEDIACMIAYLRQVDQTGRSDPKTFTIGYDGTIRQQ